MTISHTFSCQKGTWGSKSASSLQCNAVLILNLQTRTLKKAGTHQSATSIQMISLTRMRRSRVILTLFVCRTLKEDADSVWGNGEGNPCSHFHGINADDLTVLRVTNITLVHITCIASCDQSVGSQIDKYVISQMTYKWNLTCKIKHLNFLVSKSKMH